MANHKFYFQINKDGDPMHGSNIRTQRPPRSNGQHKWIEFYPEALVCCDTKITALEYSQGRKTRYYVRLDENQLPVSGSLMKDTHPPRSFNWQEVIGVYPCSSLYFRTETSLEDTINFIFRRGITLDDGTYNSDNGDFDVTVASGVATNTQADNTQDSEDRVLINGTDSCGNSIRVYLTIKFTAP